MLRIAHHTSTQHDVRQEIGADSHSEEEYEEYLRQDNTLLAACILESSRLHPILRKRAIPLDSMYSADNLDSFFKSRVSADR